MTFTKIVRAARNVAIRKGVDVRYDPNGNAVLTTIRGVEPPAYEELLNAVRDPKTAVKLVTQIRPGAKYGPAQGIGVVTLTGRSDGTPFD